MLSLSIHTTCAADWALKVSYLSLADRLAVGVVRNVKSGQPGVLCLVVLLALVSKRRPYGVHGQQEVTLWGSVKGR